MPFFRLATDASATVRGFLFFAARSFLIDIRRPEQGGWGGHLSVRRSEQMTRIRMPRLSDKLSSLQALFWAGKTPPDPFFSKDCSLAVRTQDALVTQTRGPAPPSISLGKI